MLPLGQYGGKKWAYLFQKMEFLELVQQTCWTIHTLIHQHDYWPPAGALRLRVLKASEIASHLSNWLCCISSTELIVVKSPETVYTLWLSNSCWLRSSSVLSLYHVGVPRRLWSCALFHFPWEMHYLATAHCLVFMTRLYVGWKAVDLSH